MKVVIISKAFVISTYRTKLRELSRLGVDVTAVAPDRWIEEGHELSFEQGNDAGYRVERTDLALNGHFHLHYYRGLAEMLRDIQPDILHIDEEPYNLATFLALRAAERIRCRSLFFTWQNIDRRYPPPFLLFERYAYRHVDFAIAGNRDAFEILRRKGYRGETAIIPQFGVDTELFSPGPHVDRPFTIGFLGRLVPEKGIVELLEAFKMLGGTARLTIAGDGPLATLVDKLASDPHCRGRVKRDPRVSSPNVPDLLRSIDVVVLPSKTTNRWREQYGRILVEAMSTGVAVVGSDSGEIPNVVGDAGLIVPEGDAPALAGALKRLENKELRYELGARGRERALSQFSQRSIAERTASVYGRIMGSAG